MIGDDGFAAVASCIDKIDRLEIGSYIPVILSRPRFLVASSTEHIELSIDGVIVLCNAIQNRSSPVSEKTICLRIR